MTLKPERVEASERAGLRVAPSASSSSSWYDHVDSRRAAVTAGSFWRSEPAPLLRGLAYSGSPASSRSSLMRLNSALGMKTSPRTSIATGSGERRRDGGDRAQVGRDVLAGRAVAARRALDEPAALVAQGDREAIDLELGDVAQVRRGLGGGGRPRPLRTRASKARSSSWLNALTRLSIGRRWRTSLKRRPSACHRPAGSASPGWSASGARSRARRARRKSWSYSASLSLRRVLRVVELVRPIDLGGERRVAGGGLLGVEGGRLRDERGIDRRQGDGHRPEGTERARRAHHPGRRDQAARSSSRSTRHGPDDAAAAPPRCAR